MREAREINGYAMFKKYSEKHRTREEAENIGQWNKKVSKAWEELGAEGQQEWDEKAAGRERAANGEGECGEDSVEKPVGKE